MELPPFRCHPDPLKTGSIVPSTSACSCCGMARGFAYKGPAYGRDDRCPICPWCIADGSAHARLGLHFTHPSTLEELPRQVQEEVAFRTPGFMGWQEQRWQVCCGDAAAFMGFIGEKEIRALGQEVEEAVGRVHALSGAKLDRYISLLHVDSNAFAVLFRCHHCGRYLAYEDCA